MLTFGKCDLSIDDFLREVLHSRLDTFNRLGDTLAFTMNDDLIGGLVKSDIDSGSTGSTNEGLAMGKKERKNVIRNIAISAGGV